MECPRGLLSRIDVACINLNPFCKSAEAKKTLSEIEENNRQLRKLLEEQFKMNCNCENENEEL
jgi:hypothetical protein